MLNPPLFLLRRQAAGGETVPRACRRPGSANPGRGLSGSLTAALSGGQPAACEASCAWQAVARPNTADSIIRHRWSNPETEAKPVQVCCCVVLSRCMATRISLPCLCMLRPGSVPDMRLAARPRMRAAAACTAGGAARAEPRGAGREPTRVQERLLRRAQRIRSQQGARAIWRLWRTQERGRPRRRCCAPMSSSGTRVAECRRAVCGGQRCVGVRAERSCVKLQTGADTVGDGRDKGCSMHTQSRHTQHVVSLALQASLQVGMRVAWRTRARARTVSCYRFFCAFLAPNFAVAPSLLSPSRLATKMGFSCAAVAQHVAARVCAMHAG